ncbi:hypothetical protein Tco_1031207 [Tanacetum coccineum]|uniref:DELLA protein n=1 Tax=Tanacetum coccineum TaxID=301880 RepID=A0ABQ5G9Q8_9ASTR
MVVVATQTHPYRGGDGGSRCGDGDGVAVMWRHDGGGCDGSMVAVVVAAMLDSSEEVLEGIEIMRRMQLGDMEKASRLLLMAREIQTKVHEKNSFILKLRL